MPVLAKQQVDGSILLRVVVDDSDEYKKILHAVATRMRGGNASIDIASLLGVSLSSFDPSKHPRGQPKNPGQFGRGGGGAAAGGAAGGHAEPGEGSLRKKTVDRGEGASRVQEGGGAAAGEGQVPGKKIAGASVLGKVYAPDPTASTRKDGVADAARVGVPAHATPPPPPLGRLPHLDADQRVVENRFNMAYQKDPQKFVDAYVKGKNNLVGFKVKQSDPETMKALVKAAGESGFKVKVDEKDPAKATINGDMERLKEFAKTMKVQKSESVYEIGDAPNIFNTDDCKMLSDVWNPPAHKVVPKDKVFDARSQYNTPLHQAANAIAKKAFVAYLDKLKDGPDDKKSVLVTSGGVASGKGYALGRVDAVNSVAQQCGAVWDAAGEQNATENTWILDECKKRGLKATFVFVNSDPTRTWENPERGVVERAQKIGRMVDARLFADSYAIGAQNFHAFHQGHKDEAQFFILNNREGQEPEVLPQVPKDALELNADSLYKRSVDYLKNAEVKPAVKRGGLSGEKIWPEGAAPKPA